MARSSVTYIPGFTVNFGELKKFLFLVRAAILNGGRGCRDRILKETHPRTIPVRFGLIWFSGFRGEDLNVIFYPNIPNLHNQYKSVNISHFNLLFRNHWANCNQTLVE
jgi:hypothetical protein